MIFYLLQRCLDNFTETTIMLGLLIFGIGVLVGYTIGLIFGGKK